jgi:hypothetical protein
MNQSEENVNQIIVLKIRKLENGSQQHRPMYVTIRRSNTVLEMKNRISFLFDIDTCRQRLIFETKLLKDHQTLTEYRKNIKVQKSATLIYLIHKKILKTLKSCTWLSDPHVK